MASHAEYQMCADKLLQEAEEIEKAKRPAYTGGSEDVLANFKGVAARAGLTPGQVWAVYFLKHVDAIITQMTRPDLPQAEPILGRFADAVNYLKLGFALHAEVKRPQADLVRGAVEERGIYPHPDIGKPVGAASSISQHISGAMLDPLLWVGQGTNNR